MLAATAILHNVPCMLGRRLSVTAPQSDPRRVGTVEDSTHSSSITVYIPRGVSRHSRCIPRSSQHSPRLISTCLVSKYAALGNWAVGMFLNITMASLHDRTSLCLPSQYLSSWASASLRLRPFVLDY